MPLVAPLPGRLPKRSEFQTVDAEGAPDRRGTKHHGAVDWFAPAGTIVTAPEAGKIVEVKPSAGNRGQVFGGTIKLQTSDGRVWVFRHVDPGSNYRPGQRVPAGQPLARVTRWVDRPSSSHAHIELWRSLGGGYRFENLVDPLLYMGTAGVGAYPLADADRSVLDKALGALGVGGRAAVGIGVGGVAGGIVTAEGGSILDAATALPRTIGWIAENWDRALEVLAGFVLLLVGLYRLAGQLGAPGLASVLPAGRLAKAVK